MFVDFPLGRTAGRAFDAAMQRDIARQALALLRDASAPGEIVTTRYAWADDDEWKHGAMRPRKGGGGGDDRVARLPTPQYQCAADADAADPDCPTCVWLGAEGQPAQHHLTTRRPVQA